MSAAGVRLPVGSETAELAGPAGRIEMLLDGPHGAAEAVAVICHPHPLHQGTMRNKVVHTLARFFARRGALAVRFNFRGVGGSAGEYAGGIGEVDDALAVIEWARERHPGLPLWLAGFSFGGMVAIRAAVAARPAALITVAPAIRFFGDDFVMPPCPWLIVQGEADEIVAAADVVRWARSLEPQPMLATLSSVGHFFHGSLGEISAAAGSFLDGVASGTRQVHGAAGC